MITLTGVTKNYVNRNQAVLQNVSLQVARGDFLYIVGDSGAGKTTLLKLLSGEEIPNRGSVDVLGVDLTKASSADLQKIRRKIGIIHQDLSLVDDLSVYDNVSLAMEIQDPENRAKRQFIEEAIRIVGLSWALKKKPRELSGGERSRVAAARAVVHKPQVLLADEPTGALDRDQTWNVMDLFQKLHLQGTTVLVATHDREIVRRVRRRSCVLSGGKLHLEDGLCIF